MSSAAVWSTCGSMSVPFSGHRTRSSSPGSTWSSSASVPATWLSSTACALAERVEPGARARCPGRRPTRRLPVCAWVSSGISRPTTQHAADDGGRDDQPTDLQPAGGEQDPGEQHADGHHGPGEQRRARRARRARRGASRPGRTPAGPTGSRRTARRRRSSSVATNRIVKTTTCRPTLRQTALPRRAQLHAAPKSAKYAASSVLSASHGTSPTASSAQVISGRKNARPQTKPDEGVPAGAVAAQGQVQQGDAEEGRAPPAGLREREPGEQATRDGEDESPPAGGFTGGHPWRVRQRAEGRAEQVHAVTGPTDRPACPSYRSACRRTDRCLLNTRARSEPYPQPRALTGRDGVVVGMSATVDLLRNLPRSAGVSRWRRCRWEPYSQVIRAPSVPSVPVRLGVSLARVVGSGRSGRIRSAASGREFTRSEPGQSASCRTTPSADRPQADRRRRVGREVGQQRDARARVGAPGREPPLGGLHGEVLGAPDGEVGGRADPQLAGAGVVEPRDPPAAAGVTRGTPPARRSAGRRRGAARRPGRRAQGSTGVTGESEPNASGTPAAARSASGLSAAARPAPSRVAYMPSGPPHAASNAGCMLSRTPEQDERGERRRVDHLGVLEPVAHAARSASGTLDVDGGAQAEQQLVHRAVADDVEARPAPRRASRR